MTPEFDPSRAIIFDFARGQMRDDEGSARLNLPAAALVRLCEQAGPEARKDFAQSLGSEMGRRIVAQLGQRASEASLEVWAAHLGGQLALLGLGDLSIEQWGRALVLSVEGAPAGTTEMVGQLLAASLQRALGRDAEVVAFALDERTAYLVVSADTARKVAELVGTGAGLGQVVESLHEGAA